MPPRLPALRSPPTKIAFAFIFFSFPSSSANQRARSLRASSPSKPPSPSFPSWRLCARLAPSRPRWGSRSRDPVWALPCSRRRCCSSSGSARRDFRAPVVVFLSGLGFGCAARSEATFTCAAAACAMGCEEGKERERWRRIVVALPYSPRLDESQSQRAPDIDSISFLPLPQSQRSRVAKVVCKCSFQKSKSRFCGRNDMTGWQDGVTSCSGVAATRGGRDG